MISTTYNANHRRVRDKRGRAADQQCVFGNNHSAYDWAWTHDTDPADPQNYRPMCRQHHVDYDRERRERLRFATVSHAPIPDGVCGRIVRLHLDGLNRYRIANLLTHEGVRTAAGGRFWSGATVQRHLRRWLRGEPSLCDDQGAREAVPA